MPTPVKPTLKVDEPVPVAATADRRAELLKEARRQRQAWIEGALATSSSLSPIPLTPPTEKNRRKNQGGTGKVSNDAGSRKEVSNAKDIGTSMHTLMQFLDNMANNKAGIIAKDTEEHEEHEGIEERLEQQIQSISREINGI